MSDLKYLIDFHSNTDGITKADLALGHLDQELLQASKGFDKVGQASNHATAGMKTLGGGFSAIKTAVAGYLGLNLVKNLADTADAYSALASRIRVAVGETGNVKQAMVGVQSVALQTNANLDATANLFAKVNDVGRQMGLTQQQNLELVKTINQAIAVGGGNAQSAQAAITQLTQALQSGVLRGDEFNSIMEQAPGISQALADSLGVTTGELRAMAGEGKLSSQTVIKALQEQAQAINEKYQQFPKTISQALQNISTQWQIVVGEFNSESGASAVVVNALQVIGDNLGVLKTLFDDVGAGIGWVAKQFGQIDDGTLKTLKHTLLSAYDAVKELGKSIGEMGVTVWEAFKSMLTATTPLFNALAGGQQQVSGLQGVMHGLTLGIGALSDGAKGLSIVFNGLLAGVQFLAGGLSALQAKVASFMGFETIADQAQMASDKLFLAGQKSLERANEQALAFKSMSRQALDDMQKSEQQKNAQSVADAKATMDKLFELNQQAVLDTKESEQEKLTAVQAYAQKAIDANAGVVSEQLRLELATKNYIATVNDAGDVVVEAFGDINKASQQAGLSLQEMAINAAKGLGVDVRLALNQLDPAFEKNAQAIKQVADGFDELTQSGLDAQKLLTASLDKLLDGAKSQAEIDNVRKLYVEFGKDGKLSTEQVQAGIDGINEKLQKSPQLLDDTAKALKALGIISKEEAKRQAQEQINNFELAKKAFDEGLVSAEQLQQAIGKVQKSVVLSGDASQQTWLKSQQVAMGLTNQIEATNQAINKTATGSQKMGNAIEASAHQGIKALDKLNQKLSETVAWNEKVTASSSQAKAKKDANNTTFLTAINRQHSQYSTLTGVEGFLKSAGLSQEKAFEQAKKLLDAHGKNGRINWLSALGKDSTTSPSAYLLQLAEQQRLKDFEKQRQQPRQPQASKQQPSQNNQPQPTDRQSSQPIPSTLNIGIHAKDVADVWDKRMSELVEKGLKDFMQQLKTEATRLAK